MRHWRARLFASRGQVEAAETEVARCWAAGQAGAVRLVEFLGPLAEARLATALGDAPAAAAALRRAADGGQRVAITMLVPTTLAGLACVTAVAGDASTATAAVAETRALLGVLAAARERPADAGSARRSNAEAGSRCAASAFDARHEFRSKS